MGFDDDLRAAQLFLQDWLDPFKKRPIAPTDAVDQSLVDDCPPRKAGTTGGPSSSSGSHRRGRHGESTQSCRAVGEVLLGGGDPRAGTCRRRRRDRRSEGVGRLHGEQGVRHRGATDPRRRSHGSWRVREPREAVLSRQHRHPSGRHGCRTGLLGRTRGRRRFRSRWGDPSGDDPGSASRHERCPQSLASRHARRFVPDGRSHASCRRRAAGRSPPACR
ncbi:hypothetical protein ACVIDN_005238 [Rhizobium brockwellii]